MLRPPTSPPALESLMIRGFIFLLAFSSASCVQRVKETDTKQTIAAPLNMQVAKLSAQKDEAFTAIKEIFTERNPGYELFYEHEVSSIEAQDYQQVLFVQQGQPTVSLSSGERSKTSVGEIILLAPGISMTADSALSVLRFRVPAGPEQEVPALIRPDWDPKITDTPGGCATDSNAYRRILLTWKKEVGPYVFHSLNAHRVRITNSFSHYHPIEGGFDEFYLVQMVQPDARILTSAYVSEIEKAADIDPTLIPQLIQTTPLAIGDLVYLPRGVMHRGMGGVLAQVITVPGFVPGAEIGLDHHLKTINTLSNTDSLAYNIEASQAPIIK
ncbi:MAG: hypothetical protein AB8H47_10795 [Bacteroidia bacterium]